MTAELLTLLNEFRDHLTSLHQGLDFEDFMDRYNNHLLADPDLWTPADPAFVGPLRDAREYLANRMFFRHEIPEIHDVGTDRIPV